MKPLTKALNQSKKSHALQLAKRKISRVNAELTKLKQQIPNNQLLVYDKSRTNADLMDYYELLSFELADESLLSEAFENRLYCEAGKRREAMINLQVQQQVPCPVLPSGTARNVKRHSIWLSDVVATISAKKPPKSQRKCRALIEAAKASDNPAHKALGEKSSLRCVNEEFIGTGAKTKAMMSMVQELIDAKFDMDTAMVVNKDEEPTAEDHAEFLLNLSKEEQLAVEQLIRVY